MDGVLCKKFKSNRKSKKTKAKRSSRKENRKDSSAGDMFTDSRETKIKKITASDSISAVSDFTKSLKK